MMRKKLLLMGFSGSIGKQTLDLLKEDDEYELVGIAANTSYYEVDQILDSFPSITSVAFSGLSSYENSRVKNIYLGDNALLKMIEDNKGAVILNALVGIAGLAITVKAIENNSEVLLANKESLVIGGDLIKKLLIEHPKASIFPIDSEHSALQKLICCEKESIEKLVITCSGGALRDVPLENLKNIKAEEVLAHPNWQMGKRITIDCATLVNKAFEVIEAHYLFDTSLDNIEVLMHDESQIHSLVFLKDNSMLAEIGPSDMRIPISYALYKKRMKKKSFKDFKITDLHFRKMDLKRYPLFNKIINWYNECHANMAIINAADEEAIKAFVQDKISFIDIEYVIEETLRKTKVIEINNLEDILNLSLKASNVANNIISNLIK